MFLRNWLGNRQAPISSSRLLNAALWETCDVGGGKDQNTPGDQKTDETDSEELLDNAALQGLAAYCRLVDEAGSRNLPLMAGRRPAGSTSVARRHPRVLQIVR